ncbi:unnamed protein product [Vicia faba]|uniref:Uncharacterized protein n=1 Tax=Vicia faba TaxID=3906 RepID=A0AAV0ZJY0_VICFA|nr:unnamed protein product [Vicia faba]
MASRKLKGERKIGEISYEQDENLLHAPSTKARSITINIRTRSLLAVKYSNLLSFPSHSFDFPNMLSLQKLYGLVGDHGYIYPNMVRKFYLNFNLILSQNDGEDDVITSRVKNVDICLYDLKNKIPIN